MNEHASRFRVICTLRAYSNIWVVSWQLLLTTEPYVTSFPFLVYLFKKKKALLPSIFMCVSLFESSDATKSHVSTSPYMARVSLYRHHKARLLCIHTFSRIDDRIRRHQGPFYNFPAWLQGYHKSPETGEEKRCAYMPTGLSTRDDTSG